MPGNKFVLYALQHVKYFADMSFSLYLLEALLQMKKSFLKYSLPQLDQQSKIQEVVKQGKGTEVRPSDKNHSTWLKVFNTKQLKKLNINLKV